MRSRVSEKNTSIRYEPINGLFFDIVPAKNAAQLPPKKISALIQNKKIKKGFQKENLKRFIWVGFLALTLLSGVSAWIEGKDFLRYNRHFAEVSANRIEEGVTSLKKYRASEAQDLFTEAEGLLKDLNQSVENLINVPQWTPVSNTLKAAQTLLDTGVSVSRMGQEFSLLMNDLKQVPGFLKGANPFLGTVNPLIEILKRSEARLTWMNDEALKSYQALLHLEAETLPGSLKDPLSNASSEFQKFLPILRELNTELKGVLALLGEKAPHHYLILFQNQNERRATGGFIGSYLLLTMDDGIIKKWQFKDVYETDGQLLDVVPPPPGIDQVATEWAMRDANYSPDFPTSAKQILWFLEHSRGPSADTVIAIDQTVAETVLTLLGSVRLPSLKEEINARNFDDLVSYLIETKAIDGSSPKILLRELLEELKSRPLALSTNNLYSLKKTWDELAEGGHLQVYSEDSDVEKLAERLKIDGKMIAPAPKTDYLSVITTSIGGNKSDRFIETRLHHRTEAKEGGALMNQLAITKSHTWQENDFSRWQPLIRRFGTGNLSTETLRFILGGGPNKDYLRVYVPKGSQIINVTGVPLTQMNVTEDLGYTVFGFPMTVLPGERQSVTLEYELPFKLSLTPEDHYRFLAEPQAGAYNITLKKELVPAGPLGITEKFPSELAGLSNTPAERPFTGNQIFLTALRVL